MKIFNKEIDCSYIPWILLGILLLAAFSTGTVPGLTPTQDCASGITGTDNPTCSMQIGGSGNGGAVQDIPSTGTTTDINQSSSTTTQLVALSSGKSINITHIHVVAAGNVDFSLVYGTGSNCGSGTTTIDGPMPLTTNSGYSAGTGVGAVMKLPASQALCMTTDSSSQIGGSISTSQY